MNPGFEFRGLVSCPLDDGARYRCKESNLVHLIHSQTSIRWTSPAWGSPVELNHLLRPLSFTVACTVAPSLRTGSREQAPRRLPWSPEESNLTPSTPLVQQPGYSRSWGTGTGPGERIRTSDFQLPKLARFQTAQHPEMATRGVEPRTPRFSIECSLRSELDGLTELTGVEPALSCSTGRRPSAGPQLL